MPENAVPVAAAAWLMGMAARAASDAETAKEIAAMERRAMDGWRALHSRWPQARGWKIR